MGDPVVAFVASNNLLTVNPGNSENFGQFEVAHWCQNFNLGKYFWVMIKSIPALKNNLDHSDKNLQQPK